MPKHNKAYERRKQRFYDQLKETGSQSNVELVEFKARRAERRRKPSRINRHNRREAEFWKQARENESIKQAKQEASLKRHRIAHNLPEPININENHNEPEIQPSCSCNPINVGNNEDKDLDSNDSWSNVSPFPASSESEVDETWATKIRRISFDKKRNKYGNREYVKMVKEDPRNLLYYEKPSNSFVIAKITPNIPLENLDRTDN